MLDIKFIREHRITVEKAAKDRGLKNISVIQLLEFDKKRRQVLYELEKVRYKKNLLVKKIPILKKAGKSLAAIIQRTRDLNFQIIKLEKQITQYEEEIRKIQILLPNIPHSAVPKGLPGRPNKLIRKWSKIHRFSFSPRTYLEIGQKLGIIDFSESFSKLGFDVIFYKGFGAKLQRALINFLMNSHTNKNYNELFPPIMAEGYPILKLLQGRLFKKTELPLGYVAYSLCFRKDWDFSQDIKNDLKRIRQFDSIELIKITTPKSSYEILEDMVKEVEGILRLLKIPYEIYLFTRGNLDYIAAKAYSIKAFLPGLDTFLEISICSNLTDFFSNGMNIRYGDASSNEKGYVHIVNSTNLIIPRIMIAILENFQQVDGSVIIPEVLRPYLQGIDKIGL
jgi:seryl-tRNA synthetase